MAADLPNGGLSLGLVLRSDVFEMPVGQPKA